MKNHFVINRFWLSASLIGAGSAVLILFLFDPAQFPFYPRCLLHSWTGLSCPGCGTLRAVHQLLHGNFTAAFRFNPLLVISIPFLLFATVSALRERITGEALFKRRIPALWIWFLLAIIIVFTVARNLPTEMFGRMSA